MNNYHIAADLLEDNGFGDLAQAIRDYAHFLDKRVAVFGPNFIWTGKLTGVTHETLFIEDVHQVYDTGPHDTDDFSGSRICDSMVLERAAVCNVCAPIWA
jgi:hypothetical protein